MKNETTDGRGTRHRGPTGIVVTLMVLSKLVHALYIILLVPHNIQFASAITTTGPTYYVAPTGSDANPGTEAQPFLTIAHGASVLIPGATLYVKSGTYAESFYANIPGGTSWSQPVTVAAYPGHTVTIRPSAGSGAYSVLVFAGSWQAYIIIDGFIIDAVNVFNHGIKIDWRGGAGAAHHIRIINCEVKNAPKSGIAVVGVPGNISNFNEFIRVNVHDSGTVDDMAHGIYIESDHNLVEGSMVHRNAGWGVHVYNGRFVIADDNIIRNNRIFDNARVGPRGHGIALSMGSRNLAYNNLVWGNAGGIYVQYASDSRIYHNVLYANREYGVFLQDGSINAVVQNNIVYQNSVPGIQNSGVGTVSDHNLVDIDPKFVNAAAFDFRLQSGSPAIDTGRTVSAVTSDFDGTPRPQGAAYNIGAFE